MPSFFFVRAVRLGKIFGITIELDYSWFIVFALVFYSLAFQFFPQVYGFNTTLSVLLGILTTLLFFSSVLTHELAHSVVANRNGVGIHKITLFIFGGVANLTQEPKHPGTELKIAIAGPLTSLGLSALFFGISALIAPLLPPLAVAFQYLSFINLALALFNLIPGYPLDGGRLLRAALWKKYDQVKATRIAARFGIGVGYLIVAFGIFQFLVLGSVLALVWYGFIGYFLISAARESVLQVVLMSTLEKITARDLMSPRPVVVPSDTSLRDFVEKILLGQKVVGALVTQAGQINGQADQIIGEISLEQVRRVAVADLAKLTVKHAMQPVSQNHFLRLQTAAAKALQIMAANNYERLPVIDHQRLVGAVTRDDIRVYLSVKTDVLNRDARAHARV